MLSSRVRGRFVALAAAVPLFIATGPFISPAFAVDSVRQAALVQSDGVIRIGPNAGFRGDVTRGVSGHTALVAISAATGTTINSAKISFTESGSFSYPNDFDAIDGFALFKDTNDNDRLDPTELAAGMVSQPNPGVAVQNNAIVVTVQGDPAKATGADNYLLVTHPLATANGERTVNFSVPPNGVVTSAGNLPAATVTLADVVLDTVAPPAIPLTSFTPMSRIPSGTTCPSGQAATCGDDSYKVFLPAAARPGDTLAFFNADNDYTDGALLYKNAAHDPAVYDATTIHTSSTSPTELAIGNGTGRDTATGGSTKALNNQLADDLWAVEWDYMGNLAKVHLTNAPTCTPGANGCVEPNPFVPHGNDVTAPNVTWAAPTMPQVNQSTTDLTAIPVTVAVSSADSTLTSFQTQTPIGMLATPRHVAPIAGTTNYSDVPGGTGTQARSATTIVPSASPPNLVANVDVSTSTFPEGGFIRSAARLVDNVGNATPTKDSNVVLKDTVAPHIARVSLIDVNNDGHSDTGEKIRIEFDDAMDQTAVDTESELTSRLTLTDSASSACTGPTDGLTTPCGVVWGSGATPTWTTDHVLDVTLGTPCASLSPSCPKLTRLPHQDDRLTATVNVVDRAGNPIPSANRTIVIAAPSIVPVEAITIDSANVGDPLFGTTRDGVLDEIDVTFSGDLNAASVNQASDAHHFTVEWIGDPIVATGALKNGTTDTIQVKFAVPANRAADWRTGARPQVVLLGDSGGVTLLKTQGNVPIAPLTFGSVDRAAPVPLTATTADTNANGKIDHVTVTFSEGIVQRAENDCGWQVTGYTDGNYKPHGFPSAAVCPSGANQPTAGTSNNIVTLTLAESPTAYDTGFSPTVAFHATQGQPSYQPGTTTPACAHIAVSGTASPDCPIVDPDGNGLEVFTGTAADKAAPAIVARITEDTNNDGRLDRIKVTYSETVDTVSAGSAQYAITEPVYVQPGSVSVLSATEVGVSLQNVAPLTGDTGVTPKIKSLGGTKDLAASQNTAVAELNPTLTTDKAGPAILAACASSPAGSNGLLCPADDAANDKVTILLSETIDPASVSTGATADPTADFVIEQPEGTAKALTTAPVVESDNKRVTFSFANGAIDSNAPGVVRFKAAAVVTDAVASGTKNPNVQITNAPILPAPSVTLNLACPIAATPGYCGDTKVNTGAAGSLLVSLWRLSTTARSTTPPASEFASTLPTTYPPSGSLSEGLLKLYLTGQDALGRLSTEVNSSITILKAPKINNVQFLNSQPNVTNAWPRLPTSSDPTQTVLDGDSVRVAGDAQGNDAAEWATKTTGGGCLAQYMSVDLRALTGLSSQGAVAPLSCDLKTNTAPPYRQMQFPFVKVMRTTHYPVGTVLRSRSSGSEYLIVDGTSGKQLRRKFISRNARKSWQISDGSVITVPSEVLLGIGSGSGIGYRDGAIVRASGTGYYYVLNSIKRPITSSTLAYFHIPTSTSYLLSSTELRAMGTGTGIGASGAHPVGTWVKFADGKYYQVSRNAANTVVMRRVASPSALKTLVPSSQIYPANSKDAQLRSAHLDPWIRGYRDGTVLKTSSGFAVVARSSLRRFANFQTFNSLGYATLNALTANGAAMPHVAGQSYRNGAAIDRYKITTVIIKVTNKGGAVTQAIVTPTVGGVYGVGTLDAVPGGWDFTRS
jgi:hypothetical protein